MKLAAYLKLGLSTKEIAELMKISPRGVDKPVPTSQEVTDTGRSKFI